MRNLELKARCDDEAALRRLAASAGEGGAAYVRTMRQRDTYFVTPRDRLKLREWWREPDGGPLAGAGVTPPAAIPCPATDAPTGGREDGEAAEAGAVLVAYARADTTDSRLSDYLLYPVADAPTLREALSRTLGVRVVVEKRRVLYRYGRTRIHLDSVADLGAFVELETVLADDADDADDGVTEGAAVEHRQVIELLELDRLPPVAVSYSDLLVAEQARHR